MQNVFEPNVEATFLGGKFFDCFGEEIFDFEGNCFVFVDGSSAVFKTWLEDGERNWKLLQD